VTGVTHTGGATFSAEIDALPLAHVRPANPLDELEIAGRDLELTMKEKR
jgi:hypothetical protein